MPTPNPYSNLNPILAVEQSAFFVLPEAVFKPDYLFKLDGKF